MASKKDIHDLRARCTRRSDMSTIAEILDRLTRVAVIRERLSENLAVVAELRRIVVDHERRLLRIEASNDPPHRPSRRKLPPVR